MHVYSIYMSGIYNTRHCIDNAFYMYTKAHISLRIWIPEQYYIYCRPIPMLQTGIGLVVLRVGHKKCSTVNRTYLAWAARRPLAALTAKRDITSAYFLVYVDSMHSSILSLAQFVLGVAHFSGGSSRNLLEIKLPLIT